MELLNHGKTLEKLDDNSRLRRAVLEVNHGITQHTAAEPRTTNETAVGASVVNAPSPPSAKPSTSSMLKEASRFLKGLRKLGQRRQNAGVTSGSATG